MHYKIRTMQINDCADVQKVITKTWQQTYKGIVNDNFLNNLSLNENERIERNIKNFDKDNNTYYVLDIDNNVVGFIHYSIHENNIGEINALYILNEYQDKGFGELLFEKGLDVLKELGCKKVIIGCLEGNKSNEFYKHMGATKISNRYFTNTGENLLENLYELDI